MTLSIRFYRALFALSLVAVAYLTVTAVQAADLRGSPDHGPVSVL